MTSAPDTPAATTSAPTAEPPLPKANVRTLLALAWPVVLARSSQSVVGVCDAAMSAPLGGAALAATTTGALNTFAFMILPMGTAFIVQSYAAQLFGRGDHVAVQRYAWYGLVLAAVAMAISLACLPLIGPVIGWFSYEPRVHDLMTEYMVIRVASTGAVVGTEALGNWFAGQGNTRVQMRASVVTMLANVALNWVLIYGKLGAPAMGVAGAALASTISSWIGFGVVVVAWMRARRALGLQGPLGPLGTLGLTRSEFLRMLRFGLPNGFNWFMEFAAFILFINAIVAPLGTTVVAAFNVVLQINSISFMPAFGLASAGAILVGQAIGRGAADSVGGIVRMTATVMMVWQVSVGVVYLTLPELLMHGFAPPEGIEGWIAVGGVMLAISGVWQVFDALGLAFGEALRAAGDTAWCLWARLAIAWCVFIPTAYLFVTVRAGGPTAVMWCVVFYLACLAVALGFRFRSGAWRRIQLTGQEDPILAS
ncbi:MAG: MATE family efflux transporter [Candidatus Eiseniibacteriota bacterium]